MYCKFLLQHASIKSQQIAFDVINGEEYYLPPANLITINMEMLTR